MARRRKRVYAVIGTIVCRSRKGWRQVSQLKTVFVTATTAEGARRKAKVEHMEAGHGLTRSRRASKACEWNLHAEESIWEND